MPSQNTMFLRKQIWGHFRKSSKPVITKLDEVVNSNLISNARKRRPLKKVDVPDYCIDIDDEVEDMNLGDLFDQPVLPEKDKQIVPKPTYEESLADLIEGKKGIHMDPGYFPNYAPDLPPPEYDDDHDEGIDYSLNDEDSSNYQLDELDIPNYDSLDKVLQQSEVKTQKTRKYLNKIVDDAKKRRNQ